MSRFVCIYTRLKHLWVWVLEHEYSLLWWPILLSWLILLHISFHLYVDVFKWWSHCFKGSSVAKVDGFCLELTCLQQFLGMISSISEVRFSINVLSFEGYIDSHNSTAIESLHALISNLWCGTAAITDLIKRERSSASHNSNRRSEICFTDAKRVFDHVDFNISMFIYHPEINNRRKWINGLGSG